jgi:hypothetical protein
MANKKVPRDHVRKGFEPAEEREESKLKEEEAVDFKNPTSLENNKYEAGHHMRVRDQDGKTTHRDYDGQGNHKPH